MFCLTEDDFFDSFDCVLEGRRIGDKGESEIFFFSSELFLVFDSFLVFDVGVTKDISVSGQIIELGLHLINAFDESAPLVYDAPDFSFDTRLHDPRGRLLNLSIDYEF